jgi:hypothetical protein
VATERAAAAPVTWSIPAAAIAPECIRTMNCGDILHVD